MLTTVIPRSYKIVSCDNGNYQRFFDAFNQAARNADELIWNGTKFLPK